MIASSPTVAKVVAAELCSGCGLCAGVSGGAIGMTMQAPGFARPVQTGPIEDAAEAVIAAGCPGSKVAPWFDAPHRHPYWGPYRETLTGSATDAATRFAGASGGALSALMIHALESGFVDRVLHVEADPERPTGNRLRWSRTREDVLAGAGSRYAASSPLEAIDAALAEGGRFAFVGKPCDVSALRQFARFDARVDVHVPVKLSFYCGGLPASDGADRIVRAMGLEPEDVVAFRYRGNGWPGPTVAETADGRSGEMRYADSWGRHLSRQVQFRCKICPDAVGGVADIACADAWYGGEEGYPQFEEQEGRSLIQVRTEAGEALYRSALAAGAITSEPLDIEEIALMQPSQAARKRLISARVAACRALLQPVPDMSGTDVARAARRAPLREKARTSPDLPAHRAGTTLISSRYRIRLVQSGTYRGKRDMAGYEYRPRRARRLSAGAALLLSAGMGAGSATAQSFSATGLTFAPPVRTAELDASSEVLFDSNAARASATGAALRGLERRDVRLRSALTGNLILPLEKVTLTLNGVVGYDAYLRNERLSRERLALNGSAATKVDSCDLSVLSGIIVGQNELDDLEILRNDPRSSSVNVRKVARVNGSATCGGGRIRPTAFGEFRRLRNSADGRQISNFDMVSYGGGLRYANPGFGIVTVIAGRSEFDYPERRAVPGAVDAFNLTYAGVRLDRRLGTRLQTHGEITYVDLDISGDLGRRLNGLNWDAAVTLRATDRAQVTLGAARIIDGSNGFSARIVRTSTYQAELAYALTPLLRLTVAARHRDRDFEAGLAITPVTVLRNDSIEDLTARLSYTLGRRASLTVLAAYQDRDADVEVYTYSAYRTSVGLRVRL